MPVTRRQRNNVQRCGLRRNEERAWMEAQGEAGRGRLTSPEQTRASQEGGEQMNQERQRDYLFPVFNKPRGFYSLSPPIPPRCTEKPAPRNHPLENPPR